MIKVFSGEWRGLGKKETRLGMIVSFEFRDYLKAFKGARLAVMMSIILHSNESGECWPSYDTLMEETGYTRGTVATALNELCELMIESCRVLTRFRLKDEAGKFTGSNHYLIFPTPEEVFKIEGIDSIHNTENYTLDDNHSIKKPTVEKTNVGIIKLEVKPDSKEKPELKRPRNEFRAPVPENPTGDPYPSLSGESQPTVSEKPAGGKPDSSKRSAAPPEKLSNLYPIALALAEVAGMDFLKNKGRLFKEAKTYYQEGDDQRIRREYGPGGDWYLCDWRGRLAQFPTLSHIRETWGILKPPPPQQPNGKSQPNQQEAIRSIYRDI